MTAKEEEKKSSEVDCIGYPSLLEVPTHGLPLLTSKNWIEWNAVLCHVLLPYEGAVEIMTGRYKPGSPQYSKQTDVELLSLLHRLVSSELRVNVRLATHSHGHRGSKVYEALKYRYSLLDLRPQQHAVQAEVKALVQKQGERMGQYIDQTRELFFRASEVNVKIDEQAKIEAFLTGILVAKMREQASGWKRENPRWTWEQLASPLRLAEAQQHDSEGGLWHFK